MLRYAPAASVAAAAAARTGKRRFSTRGRSRHADGLGAIERAALHDRYAEEALLTGRNEESVTARRAALALYRQLGEELRVGPSRA